MADEVVDEKYERICKKLGFIPTKLPDEPSGYEDDSKINSFSVLEMDELLYLIEHNYLGEPVSKKVKYCK